MLVCLTIKRIAHFKDNLTKTAIKTLCECTHGSLKLYLEVRIVVNVCVPVLGAAIVALPIAHLPPIIPYTMSNSLISYQQCHIESTPSTFINSSPPLLVLVCPMDSPCLETGTLGMVFGIIFWLRDSS